MQRHLVFTDATLERVDSLALDALFLFVDGERPMRGLASHMDARLNMRISRALATHKGPAHDSAWLFACEKKSSCARVLLLDVASNQLGRPSETASGVGAPHAERGEGRLQPSFAGWREGAIAPSSSNLEHDQRSLVVAHDARVFSWMRKMRLRRVGVHFAMATQEAADFDAHLARFLSVADDTLPWDEFHVLCPPELHKRHGHVLEVFRRRAESDASL